MTRSMTSFPTSRVAPHSRYRHCWSTGEKRRYTPDIVGRHFRLTSHTSSLIHYHILLAHDITTNILLTVYFCWCQLSVLTVGVGWQCYFRLSIALVIPKMFALNSRCRHKNRKFGPTLYRNFGLHVYLVLVIFGIRACGEPSTAARPKNWSRVIITINIRSSLIWWVSVRYAT